jgi:hypothetical protein
MTKVTVACDVCGGLVEGTIAHTDGFTGGFYLRGWVTPPNKATQNDLFPEGKNIVCDFDMQDSKAYQALYGNKAALVAHRAPARMPRNGERVRTYDECLLFIKEGKFPDA